MLLDVGDLKQIVLDAAAQKENRLALILPIMRVRVIWPDADGMVSDSHG